MSGVRGRRTPEDQENFIIALAREDPSRTNVEIRSSTIGKFGDAPDSSTIGRIRDRNKIPSSREARTNRPSLLTSNQEAYVRSVLNKMIIPDPDSLRLTNVIIATDVGSIGPTNMQIHVRFSGRQLSECWLSAKELNDIQSIDLSSDLLEEFVPLHNRGMRIVSEIVNYNQQVDLGSGDPTFSEVVQMLETSKPNQLGNSAKLVWKLWLRCATFGRELDRRKQGITKTFTSVVTS